MKIQPEANLDPASTVYEILDKCPTALASDEAESRRIFNKLQSDSRLKIEQLPSSSSDDGNGLFEIMEKYFCR